MFQGCPVPVLPPVSGLPGAPSARVSGLPSARFAHVLELPGARSAHVSGLPSAHVDHVSGLPGARFAPCFGAARCPFCPFFGAACCPFCPCFGAARCPICPVFPGGPAVLVCAAPSACPSSPASRELISAGHGQGGNRGLSAAWGAANRTPTAVCLPKAFPGPFPPGRRCHSPPSVSLLPGDTWVLPAAAGQGQLGHA